MQHRRSHDLALLLATAAAAWIYVWLAHLSAPQPSFLTSEYTRALAGGHSYLRIAPDPRLLALRNPYDPRVNGGLHPLDVSLYRGRYYLYFGITPFATVLAPVFWATGWQVPDVGAITGYALAATVCLALIFRDAARRHFPRAGPCTLALALFSASLSGAGLLLIRPPGIYQLVLAAAWFHGIVAVLFAYAALHAGRLRLLCLALAGANAGLVVGARPNQWGAACVVAAFIFFEARRPTEGLPSPGKRICAAFAPLGAAALAIAWFNWMRFDSPFEFGFHRQLGMFDQHDGGFLSARFAASNLWYYAIGWPRWSGWFPFFEWPASPPIPAPAGYTLPDQVYGAIVTAPLAFLAAFLFRRRESDRMLPRAFSAVVLGCGASNLAFLALLSSAVYRYQADFMPYFALGGGLGLLALADGGDWRRRAVFGAGTVVAAFSAAASFCAAAALYDITRDSNPAEFAALSRWFDAPRLEWERLRRTPLREFKVRVLLPSGRFGRDEPLLVTGHAGLQDFIYMNYAGPGLLRVGFEAIGRGGPVSNFIPVDYARPVTIELVLGCRWPPPGAWVYRGLPDAAVEKLRRHLTVKLNGGTILDKEVVFHPDKGLFFWGRSPDDDAFGSSFSGAILEISEPALNRSIILDAERN